MKKVAVILGSKSDLKVVEKAFTTLEELNIPIVKRIYSAHRSFDKVIEFCSNAKENGIGVIIAAAGMAAHLAGSLAAQCVLPVIGVPIDASFNGLDALLSTVQMPPGIPVASMGVNAAENAALFAAEILALENPDLEKALIKRRKKGREKVLKDNEELNETTL